MHPLLLVLGFFMSALLGVFEHTAWWYLSAVFAVVYGIGLLRSIFS